MKEKHQSPIEQYEFSPTPKLFLFLGILVFVCFCALVSPFTTYHYLISRDAMSLMPPIYPDSLEVVSKENSYAGSCCVATIWVYCTEASVDELISYFEPFVGEFEFYEFDSPMIQDHYHAGISSDNPLTKQVSYLTGFGGYGASFEVFIEEGNERCTTRSSYVYRISYPAA